MARSQSGESLLERAVRIFEAFDPDTERLTIGALARRARLPSSTTSRLVDQMVDLGLLQRGADKQIGIGLRMWELALRAAPTRGLREAALPYLQNLHAVVGQHAQLGIPNDDEVIFVERLSAPGAVVNITKIAGRLPLHASSSGLVLLANTTPERRDRVISGPLKRYTADTITDPGVLRNKIAEIQRSGYALCDGYITPEATGIAVPVRDLHGSVVATVSVIVPRDGMPIRHVEALRVTARGIERSIRSRHMSPDHW